MKVVNILGSYCMGVRDHMKVHFRVIPALCPLPFPLALVLVYFVNFSTEFV